MLHFLRRLLAPDIVALHARVERLERTNAEREADLTSLTDKLTNQLKSMRQRHVRGVPDKTREEIINEAIRARRARRMVLVPPEGESNGVR